MSLLNITNDGLPNILAVLHATVLRSAKPISEADLLESVSPAAIVEDDAQMARNTLTRWTELGLFVRKDGLITVKERLSGRRATALEIQPFTRRMACRLALSEENNQDLWASHGARAADLTRTLAWMLAQDVYRTSSFSNFADKESQQILDPERLLMRNDTRRSGIGYWAPFLGFSRHSFAVIDPTVAVRDSLDEVLTPGQGMPAAQFVERLGTVLPVLDGGRWQIEVLKFIDSAALPRLQPSQLSSALSRALLTLWGSGELLLQQKADLGSSVMLTGAGGVRSDLTFQWVARPKETKA